MRETSSVTAFSRATFSGGEGEGRRDNKILMPRA